MNFFKKVKKIPKIKTKLMKINNNINNNYN